MPVPKVKDLEELNELLLEGCRADQQRRIAGKPHTVGAAIQIEREHLLPLAAEGFDLAETSFPVVDSKGCVKVRTNWYSTPLIPGTHPRVKLLAAYVEIWEERECVARHERSFGRYEQVLDLETTWKCWSGSPARWLGRVRWHSGESGGAGRRASTDCARA